MIRSVAALRVGLAAIATACTGVFAVPAANANPLAPNMLCGFNGVTGTLNPPIPFPPAGREQDGLYSFTGSATCTVADLAGSSPQPAGPVAVRIEANGYYTNMMVGTGNLSGAACMWTTDAAFEIGTTTCPSSPLTPTQATLVDYFHLPGGTTGNMRFGFGIDFVAGHSRVYELGGGGYGPAIETGQTGPDAYHLWGSVHITPNQLPPAPAVSSFTVSGAFIAES